MVPWLTIPDYARDDDEDRRGLSAKRLPLMLCGAR
jgi:hypothetical protein